MRLRLYDSPGGIFNINSPGTLLDQTDLTGIVPGPDNYTFNWVTVAAGLDASSSTDGNVTLMFDLIQRGYASFDNLLITASNVGAGIGCPAATISVQCLADVPAAPVLEGFDNCDPDPVVTYGETVVVSNPNDRVITRTWTVTDDAKQFQLLAQTVTVLDTEAPAITCPRMFP
ncbi:MAG: hypothetical protein IPJ00_20790 [Saprospirales bacterium]|nr:hypothetical protein [Saprospirales bacterium]